MYINVQLLIGVNLFLSTKFDIYTPAARPGDHIDCQSGVQKEDALQIHQSER